jgi:nicotinate-nucleotide pyrophosphorylase (carboxylating)
LLRKADVDILKSGEVGVAQVKSDREFSVDAAVVAEVVSRALEEDVGAGDLTTKACVPPGASGLGRMVAKAQGVVAGLPVAEAVFHRVEPSLAVRFEAAEGQAVGPGEALMTVEGPLAGQLVAERVALNFVQRLSGVSTLTRRCVEAAGPHRVTILDTRKTTPGLRALERYAVRVGGGQNYRAGLFDMVLIKDNHIAAADGIKSALERARSAYGHTYPVVVEVSSLEELEETLGLEVDRVMLDNFSTEDIRKAVAKSAGRVALEASGGMRPELIAEVASSGVSYISVGALTHAAPALDISFSVTPAGRGRDQ